MRKNEYVRGLIAGIPIALGYFSVSFGFGIMAVRAGLSALAATGISASNLTSAGQVAGVGVIAAAGTIIEMILTQLVINMRYALMGISLTQKLSPSFNMGHRLVVSWGITDEIFAVASTQSVPVVPSFMYGLIALPFVGWTSGTLLGAVAGQLLPEKVSEAMGILIYGMFIAIVVPVVKEKVSALLVSIFAVALSCVFHYCVPQLSAGISIVICAVVASLLGAVFFPVKEESEAEI